MGRGVGDHSWGDEQQLAALLADVVPFSCRVFYGITTEETILREIGLFWELLGSTDAVLRETYIVATYQNPSVPQCRNEIWFIRRAE